MGIELELTNSPNSLRKVCQSILVYVGIDHLPHILLDAVSLDVRGNAPLSEALAKTSDFVDVGVFPVRGAQWGCWIVKGRDFDGLLLVDVEVWAHAGDDALIFLPSDEVHLRSDVDTSVGRKRLDEFAYLRKAATVGLENVNILRFGCGVGVEAATRHDEFVMRDLSDWAVPFESVVWELVSGCVDELLETFRLFFIICFQLINIQFWATDDFYKFVFCEIAAQSGELVLGKIGIFR